MSNIRFWLHFDESLTDISKNRFFDFKQALRNSIILKIPFFADRERAILPEVRVGSCKRQSSRLVNRYTSPILHRGFPFHGKLFLRRGVVHRANFLGRNAMSGPRLAALEPVAWAWFPEPKKQPTRMKLPKTPRN